MRNLPIKRSEKQNLIINAVKDFVGEGGDATPRNIINAALWIMGRKRGITLDDYEKEIVWYVEKNLEDSVYRGSLASEKYLLSPTN